MDRQRSMESRARGKKSALAGERASATGGRLVSSKPLPDLAEPAASSSSEDADWEDLADDDHDGVPSDEEQEHVSVDSSSSNGDEQAAVALTAEEGTVSQGISKRVGKRRKGSPKATGRQKQRSDCWKIFKVVNVPSKTKKGEIDTRAKCRFCYKIMSYKQGGATSHLMRHIPKCTPYLNKVAKMKAQTNLNFGPAMGASSVSSESTFSAGGRVLDDYRSSLCPAMVQHLVCASSWIRGAHDDMRPPIVVEEDEEDDVQTIPFPQSVVGSN